MKSYYLYILASKKNSTLYTGVTNNLIRRTYEHKENLVPGFTRKYNVCHLVYYEEYTDIYSAIAREKRIKKWKRQWKINLIEKVNPDWQDLYDQFDYRPEVARMDSSTNVSHCYSYQDRKPSKNGFRNNRLCRN